MDSVTLAFVLQAAGIRQTLLSFDFGHSQFPTTLDHYTGWMPAADRAAAECMDSLIDEAKNGLPR